MRLYGDMSDRLITKPDAKHCNNCHAYLKDDDLYCRICGTKRGQGTFEPYNNIMQTLYGPCPVERTHECKNCGYSWKTVLMIDDEDYCPKCGAKTLVTETYRNHKRPTNVIIDTDDIH